MQESIRPVAVGFIFGVICLIFGIFWAIYIVVGHDRIHKTLGESAAANPELQACEGRYSGVSGSKVHAATHVHSHKDGHEHPHDDMPRVILKREVVAGQPAKSACDDMNMLMDTAHERLTRGHIHEMGLGILTIAVSFVLAFMTMPDRVKTFASICIGFGSLFYPIAWIVMGYRTLAMGLETSAESILPIVAGSVPLVLLGLFITLFYLVKGLFVRKSGVS